METKQKPTVKLIGEDGNAFAILGRVRKALRKAGYSTEELSGSPPKPLLGTTTTCSRPARSGLKSSKERGEKVAIYQRKLKNGEKRYDGVIYVPTPGGGKKQKWHSFSLKRDAQDWVERNHIDVRQGTYREMKKANFAQFYEQSWKPNALSPARKKLSSIRVIESLVRNHLIPHIGQHQMTAIDSEVIEDLETKLLETLPRSFRAVLANLNTMLNDAVRKHYIRVNPMKGVKLTKAPKSRKGIALTPDQINWLIEYEEFDETDQLLILTGVLTGMRQGEQFGLQWSDIDFDNNVIHVRQLTVLELREGHAAERAWLEVDVDDIEDRRIRTRHRSQFGVEAEVSRTPDEDGQS